MSNSRNVFLKNLKEGRCKGCKYMKVVSGGGWSFLGCYYKPYKGKWVAEVKDCPIGKTSHQKESDKNENQLF